MLYESTSALDVCESMSITTANVNLIYIPETHNSMQTGSGSLHVGGHALPQSLYTFNPGHWEKRETVTKYSVLLMYKDYAETMT